MSGMIIGRFRLKLLTVVIIQPPSGVGSGGGGIAVHPGVYVQWPKKITPKTKMVVVTVKFSEDTAWRRVYTVDGRRADITVKAVNIINKTVDKISVGVDSIKKAVRSVTAIFKDADK